MNADELVAKGVDLLDRERPDWRSSINLETLDLKSTKNCILGQVFGSYYDGLWALNLSVGYDYGFSEPFYPEYSEVLWDDLLQAWVRELTR